MNRNRFKQFSLGDVVIVRANEEYGNITLSETLTDSWNKEVETEVVGIRPNSILVKNPWSGWGWYEQTDAEYISGLTDAVSVWWIHHEKVVIRIVKRAPAPFDGLWCVDCGEPYPMAAPNFQKNKLICFRCRDSLGWKYGIKNGEVFLK